jgi:hypothetical protein
VTKQKSMQRPVQRKVPLDGYIKPSDRVVQNINPPTPSLPDPQIMPVPPAADRHVVPAPQPRPVAPLVA